MSKRFGTVSLFRPSLLCICLLLVLLHGPLSRANFQGNAAHDGYSPASGPADVARTVWAGSPPAGKAVSVGSAVAVGGGRVFAHVKDVVVNWWDPATEYVCCFDRADGSLLWTSPGLGANALGSVSSPVFDPDTGDVFFGSGTHLYRLDPDAAGAVVWSATLPYDVINGSALVLSASVAVCTKGGPFDPPDTAHLLVYNKVDGATAWTVQHGGSGGNAPASDGSALFDLVDKGTPGDEVRGYDLASGATLWTSTCDVANFFFGGLSYSDGYLYAQSYDFFGQGELVKVDATDGSQAWIRNGLPAGGATPVVGAGRVIVFGGGFNDVPTVTAYSTGGDLLWTTELGWDATAAWIASVAQAGDYVYVAGGNGLWVLDAADGSVVANSRQNDLAGTPVVDDGCVLAPAADGKIYCLSAITSGVRFWDLYE